MQDFVYDDVNKKELTVSYSFVFGIQESNTKWLKKMKHCYSFERSRSVCSCYSFILK